MRRLPAFVVLGSLFAASVAAADSPAPRPHQSMRAQAMRTGILSTLPNGRMSMPRSAYSIPSSIPAGEKLEGFFVEVPGHFAQMKEAPHYVQLWSSQADRDARSQGQVVEGAPTCFMNAYPSGGSDVNWSGSLNTTTTVQNYARSGSSAYGNVQMVRSERIKSETPTQLTYEITFAYVDSVTQGVRLHSRQTMDMALVRELPGKVKVWGTQVGGEGGDEAMFLVRRERHEKERFFFGPLVVTVNGAHSSSASDACPVTFTLSSKKGVAASAVVHVETLLGIEDVSRDDESGFDAGMAMLQGEARQANGPREAKLRPMRIGVSSTWMSQDVRPVLSVSHGWAGRERTQAI